jgi:hypothetical protein
MSHPFAAGSSKRRGGIIQTVSPLRPRHCSDTHLVLGWYCARTRPTCGFTALSQHGARQTIVCRPSTPLFYYSSHQSICMIYINYGRRDYKSSMMLYRLSDPLGYVLDVYGTKLGTNNSLSDCRLIRSGSVKFLPVHSMCRRMQRPGVSCGHSAKNTTTGKPVRLLIERLNPY